MYAIRSYYGLARLTNHLSEITAQSVLAGGEKQFLAALVVCLKAHAVVNHQDPSPRRVKDGLNLILGQRQRLVGVAQMVYRITSYNVCYTKLLR